MKFTHTEKHSKGTRFNFNSHGYFCYMDLDTNGNVVDSTFKPGSAPYQEQLKLVQKNK